MIDAPSHDPGAAPAGRVKAAFGPESADNIFDAAARVTGEVAGARPPAVTTAWRVSTAAIDYAAGPHPRVSLTPAIREAVSAIPRAARWTAAVTLLVVVIALTVGASGSHRVGPGAAGQSGRRSSSSAAPSVTVGSAVAVDASALRHLLARTRAGPERRAIGRARSRSPRALVAKRPRARRRRRLASASRVRRRSSTASRVSATSRSAARADSAATGAASSPGTVTAPSGAADSGAAASSGSSAAGSHGQSKAATRDGSATGSGSNGQFGFER